MQRAIRRIIAAAIMLAPGGVASVCAQADTAADARKMIQAVYTKRDAAEQKKDLEGSLSSLAPDFVFEAKDGQRGDAKLLKRRLTPLIMLMQSVKSKSEITKFAFKGKDAKATVKAHLEMLVLNPQTQVPQRVVADATSEDLWTKTATGWLQKKMTTKSETASLNGKSISEQLDLNGKPGKPGGSPKNKSAKKAG